MVNRMVVGAHYGLRDWIFQRMTAVIMIVYVTVFFVQVVGGPKLDFATWRMLFTPQWMKLATLLFLVSLYLHAWVGVRNIFMDYIKPTGLRVALYAAVILALVAYGAWAVQILWGR